MGILRFGNCLAKAGTNPSKTCLRKSIMCPSLFLPMMFFVVTSGQAASNDLLLSSINQYCRSQIWETITSLPNRFNATQERGDVDYARSNDTIATLFQDLTEKISETFEERFRGVQRDMRSTIDRMLSQYEPVRCCRRITELEEGLEKLRQLVVHGWGSASNGLLYKFFRTTKNYAQAKADCQSKGSRLASTGIRDPALLRELTETFVSGQRFWIGLTDIAREGTWVWQDGISATTSDSIWYNGEPNNAGGNEDCAYLLPTSGTWKANDTPCETTVFGYLCEKSV